MLNLFTKYKFLFSLILIIFISIIFLLFDIWFIETLSCNPNDNTSYVSEYWSTRNPLIIDKGITHEMEDSNNRSLNNITTEQISTITSSTTYEVGQNRPIYEVANTPSHASYAWSNQTMDGNSSDKWSTVTVNSYYNEEVTLPKKGWLGKIRVGFNYIGPKVNSVYIKYHDISKRKFYWNIWEKNTHTYSSYEDFKREWNPNTKIWKEISKKIKKDIQKDVADLLHIKNPFDIPLNGRNRDYIQDFMP